MTYKDSQRRQTEARVREKDATAARRRNAELDQELDERIGRDRSVCSCRHPWSAHEHIPGVEFSADVVVTGENGVREYGLPDVWVCSGGRLVADPENADPWDCVCGCVLHDPPPTS